MSIPPVLQECLELKSINSKTLVDVIQKSKDWALMHGAAMRSKKNFCCDSLQFAPFILTPSSFPRKEFEKAIKLQTILNELMHWVANDEEFLRETLQSTIKVDSFTGNLFKIYEEVLKDGFTQPIQLGMLRSDIMLESSCPKLIPCAQSKAYCCWKQVEINTIASGFGHLGPASTNLQRYILQELGAPEKLKDLPENLALSGLCAGLTEAWKMTKNPKGVILFVIENVSYNICDQRFHEFEIRRTNPEIQIIRRTLTELHTESILDKNRNLIVDGFHVNVIYFRSGYEPPQFPTENEWASRLLIEKSTAIKCPSINYHLAGTKKVQQALAKPGILKRFLDDEEQINMIKEIFTGLFSLDKGETGDAAVKLALDNPEKYVLKPQREGGGNNIYGADIPVALKNMDDDERSAWILMERIFPPISKGYMIRPNEPVPPKVVDLVSELGIFGVIIGDKKKIHVNRQVGHMLRTKLATANEGGVAAGLGALDSPYLID